MTPLLTFAEIQGLTQGRWIHPPLEPNSPLRGAAFDTRDLGEAQIFVTFSSERADGHEHLAKLAGTSIRLALVTREVPSVEGVAMLLVEDGLQALHEMARVLAHRFEGRIVNLTGSSGKTTVKTWLKSLLEERFKLVTNQKSFNNHIGCPVTILNLAEDSELLILEMGTNGLGELELLSSLAPADVTLLLNVGHAHVGRFGGIENTYLAKLEIFSHRREGGLAIVPAWDEKILQGTESLARRTFSNKVQAEADASFEVLERHAFSQRLKLFLGQESLSFEVDQVGEYVGFSLAAVALVLEALGLDPAGVLTDPLHLPQEKGRSTLIEGPGGSRILNDCYNANPESAVNMMKTLVSLPGETHIAVLGNMGELDEGLTESAGVILEGIPQGLDELHLSGETGRTLAPLIRERRPELTVEFHESYQGVVQVLQGRLQEGVNLAVKGSRAAHMERVILALQGGEVGCALGFCPLLMMCDSCEKLAG